MQRWIIWAIIGWMFLGGMFPAIAQEPETPPAILHFDWLVRRKDNNSDEPVKITLSAVERGELELTLSWGVLNAYDGDYHVELDTYRIQAWEPILADDNDPDRPHSINGSRVLDLQHPLNFGLPTYRLSLFDSDNHLLETQIITIPYESDPTFDSRPQIAELTAPLNTNVDSLGSIPVTWQVEHRWPGTNLAFEQVLPDGSVWSAELPRAHQWIASSGQGILQAKAPTAGNAIILRLRVVNMQTGETYDQAAVVIAVTPGNERTEDARTQGSPPVNPTQSVTGSTSTINTGQPPTTVHQSEVTTQAAFQRFEDGFMIWNSAWGDIWVLSNTGQAFFYNQDHYAALPDNPIDDPPPTGLFSPVRGFGKVWGNYLNVREILGWAVAEETGYTIDIETSDVPTIGQGVMVVYIATLPNGRQIRVRNDGTWEFYEGETATQLIQRIDSFEVLPPTYYAGELMSVNWQTQNADRVTLELYDLPVAESTLPFQRFDDLAPSGTLNLILSDEHLNVVRFVLTAVRIDNAGQFDTSVFSTAEVQPITDSMPDYNITFAEAAFQQFEGGFMLWRGDTDDIYALYSTGGVSIVRVSEYGQFTENPVTDSPPSGYVKPVSGFGRVWGNITSVRDKLGWGLNPEQGYRIAIYTLVSASEQSQVLLSLPTGERIVIRSDQTWARLE